MTTDAGGGSGADERVDVRDRPTAPARATHRIRQRTPLYLLVPAAIGLACLVLPMLALLARVDWPTVPATIGSPEALQPLALSLIASLTATLVCVVLGVPLGVWLARAPDRVANWVRPFVLVPLLLPPMVGGVALIALLGRSGVIGGPLLQWLGVGITMTPVAVVIAQVFVAMPFLVITTESAVRAIDPRLEPLAATLGASPGVVALRVTLPIVAPSIGAGAMLAASRALAEFGATALFAGNVPGVTRTAPLAIYTAYAGSGSDRQTALAIAVMLLVASLGLLAGMHALRLPVAGVASGSPRSGRGSQASARRRPPSLVTSGEKGHEYATHLEQSDPSREGRGRGRGRATEPQPEPLASGETCTTGKPLRIRGLDVPRRGLRLRLDLDVQAGERLAVLGPNGAGKSTLLDAIAGLAPTDAGSIAIGARTVSDAGTPDGPPASDINVVPERRRVGLLRQDALLFPHLDVLDNVAFGLRAHGATRAEARPRALATLERLGASDLAGRPVASLSGGQRQRVALARALATEPHLLLLDEPFAALDVDAAADLRALVTEHLERTGVTCLLVTHELVDASQLCSRAIVLEAGRVLESTPLAELMSAPRSAFGAAIAGLGRAAAEIDGDAWAIGEGRMRVPRRLVDERALDDAPGSVPDPSREPAPDAVLVAAPEDVRVALSMPSWADDANGTDRIRRLTGRGRSLEAQLECGLVATLGPGSALRAGDTVTVQVLRASAVPEPAAGPAHART